MSKMNKDKAVKAVLWVLAAIIFLILTAEVRDLVLFIMLAVVLAKMSRTGRPY